MLVEYPLCHDEDTDTDDALTKEGGDAGAGADGAGEGGVVERGSNGAGAAPGMGAGSKARPGSPPPRLARQGTSYVTLLHALDPAHYHCPDDNVSRSEDVSRCEVEAVGSWVCVSLLSPKRGSSLLSSKRLSLAKGTGSGPLGGGGGGSGSGETAVWIDEPAMASPVWQSPRGDDGREVAFV
jgi:hypothetical protein